MNHQPLNQTYDRYTVSHRLWLENKHTLKCYMGRLDCVLIDIMYKFNDTLMGSPPVLSSFFLSPFLTADLVSLALETQPESGR